MKISRLLAATALVSAGFAIPQIAWAQAQQPERAQEPTTATAQEEEGETVLVTGSRIPRPEYEGVLPGVQVTAEDIAARGFTNALEALNDTPLVGPGASPFNGNNGGQAASLGAAFVDLLDLGTQRTLTLVNGRRFVSGNAASLFVDSNATGSQVDVNVIPSSLISRIDIITVGGAPAYGSDAIAGVVNIILKNNFEGYEFNALAGITERGDAAQYQLAGLAGINLLDDTLNLTLSGEYTRIDGLQADAREHRLRRAATITNASSGAKRNPNFQPGIIDVVGQNNGAFLRGSDDGVSANLLGEGFINQTLSFTGTVLNVIGFPAAPESSNYYNTPNTQGFINLRNGIGNAAFTNFNTAAQLVNGLPSGNGLNGRTTPIGGLAITTFAPTALPTGVTPAQVFAQFGITPPAGANAGQLTTLAINVLQANRPTAREFFTNNPNVNVNYFIGTFIPNVPRIANTDTTLVTVAGVQVPVNQVLPFVAVPLEFTPDGNVRPYTLTTMGPNTPGTMAQAIGSNGGFSRSIENIVLRTQQDRYIGNLNATWEFSPGFTFFSENLFSHVRNVSLRNSPSQNFVTTGTENAALIVRADNPYLDAADRAQLAAVGISGTSSFALTRQNQDIFGDNPSFNTSDTYRLTAGLRAEFGLLGKRWMAEVSGTYGHSKQVTRTTQINDIEYQLALDAVDEGLARGGPANGNIVCRAKIFPGQYLGFTPTGTASNLTRQPGAGGIPTEVVITPKITQAMIDQCSPMNPFGYNQMSEASKAYVRQNTVFTNISKQTFAQASLAGDVFDLPGGPLGVAFSGEYRKEELFFTSDPLNQLGRGRSAPSATTEGYIEAFEAGAEARIPIFGRDFGLGELSFEPAVRFSKQSGKAATYRNLAGNLVSPESSGDWESIWTLGGTWRPIPDVLFRGNITRSIRQPGVVELFLGGQPAFAAPTDPCGPTIIDSGASATARRANCRAAVIAAGIRDAGGNLITTSGAADAFLATFIPNPASLPGSFAGAPGLEPERGRSYTFGGVLTPRFIPGLSLSADYIALDLDNMIQPTTLAQALQFCYQSTTFPNTSAQTGANTCGFFTRDTTTFQVAPGFASGYINLSATEVRAINISGRYAFNLPSNLGRFSLRGNAYHLIRYTDSAAGDFSDKTESAGTFARPKWETQLSGRYEKDGFFAQLTWNWRAKTRLFSGGAPATIELAPIVEYPSTNVFDLAFGADLDEKFRIQLNIVNLTDKIYAGSLGLYNAQYIDQIGRRFQLSVNGKF